MPKTDDERIAALKTPDQCLVLAKNARERGRPDLALRAERRRIELQSAMYDARSDAEKEALQAVYAYELALSELRGRNVRANRTWQVIRKRGVIEAVERIVLKKTESQGYRILIDKGLEDMCFEAVVLRHPKVFSDDAVRASEERIAEHEAEKS